MLFIHLKKIYFFIIYFYFLLKLILVFRGKRVAVVGGSPNITLRENGNFIDSHDYVIRVNLFSPDCNQHRFYGAKTSFRFIGATMVDKHQECIPRLHGEAARIITTIKNKKFFLGVNNEFLYYPRQTPMYSYAIFRIFMSKGESFPKLEKPPKSGTILLIILGLFGRCRELNAFGFSLDEKDAWEAMNYLDNNKYEYDSNYIYEKHCNPEVDINVLSFIKEKGFVNFI
ncbi:glycosyltransferase family 29 protein [Marinobacterium sp. YM272]|uniref:glycosyltransferase family 29 protein n=1 Tax=Marinobacterium sp. YM272 TaxID=3421654 RepID=UPI003D7F3FC3